MKRGFSIIEVILSVGLFVIFASGGMRIVLQGLQMNRLGSEQTVATQYATEGLEAVRSIRNRAFSNLLNSANLGLGQSSGMWTFSGTNNTFGKYTRVISIADVNRDDSGNIVSSGGTVDPYTKKVTSTVNWKFIAGAQNKAVALSSYVTDFKGAPFKGGMFAYANVTGAGDQIQYQLLDGKGNWGAVQTIPDYGVPGDRPARQVNLFSSATRDEKILVTKHVSNGSGDDTYLYVSVWDGTTTTWNAPILLASWAGVTLAEARDFDGDYLNNGDFLLIYEDEAASGNIPKYALWDGSNWTTGSTTANVGAGETPDWIVVRNRPGTNQAMIGIRDSGDDTLTFMRNDDGTWSNVTSHATTSSGTTYDTIDFAWSTNTTNAGALIFNDGNNNTPNFRIWNGTAWSNIVQTVNIGAVPRAMNVVSRPGANEFLSCFKDSQNDINCVKATFTTGTYNPVLSLVGADIETSTDTGAQRSFSLRYEKQTGGAGLVVYSDATTTPKYRVYNPVAGTFGPEQSLTPPLTGGLETVSMAVHPDNDDILVSMGGTRQGNYTVAWDGDTNTFFQTGGYALLKHGNAGSQDQDFWFDFAWDRF